MNRVAVLAALALAGQATAAQVESIVVAHAKGTFTVDATMVLQAPVAAVRAALTDYEHLGRLSPAIEASHLVSRDGGVAVVRTRTRACVGWFCRALEKVERVTETADTIVAEADPTQSNVERSITRWHFVAIGATTRVDWRVEVDPKFFVPPLVGPPLVKSAMKREGQQIAVGLEAAARVIAQLPPLPAAPAKG